jgi:hypothetical protein
MREEYCTFTGKVSHPSENAARRALSNLKRAKDYNGHVYFCKECGRFHIGRIGRRTDRNSLTKKKEKKKYVKRDRSVITIYLTEEMGLVEYGPSKLQLSGEALWIVTSRSASSSPNT